MHHDHTASVLSEVLTYLNSDAAKADDGYSKPVLSLIDFLNRHHYTLVFDWQAEAASLQSQIRNPDFIRQASLEQIQKLFTYLIRSERFCTGTIGMAIQSGQLAWLIARALELPMPNKH